MVSAFAGRVRKKIVGIASIATGVAVVVTTFEIALLGLFELCCSRENQFFVGRRTDR